VRPECRGQRGSLVAMGRGHERVTQHAGCGRTAGTLSDRHLGRWRRVIDDSRHTERTIASDHCRPVHGRKDMYRVKASTFGGCWRSGAKRRRKDDRCVSRTSALYCENFRPNVRAGTARTSQPKRSSDGARFPAEFTRLKRPLPSRRSRALDQRARREECGTVARDCAKAGEP
jgi:hypothetical protein